MTTATAKLFWTGNSQAIRLPKAFRFEGNAVNIKKQGNKVIIEPIVDDWAWLDELRKIGEPDPSLEEAVKELRSVPPQERDWRGVFE
ncbi:MULTISPECIES: antitoxin [unclassified Moraxella]|uniref:antitoxin n=1 Tax=unclassified Moraxella TaxID=2685852 RepID=UPI003AF9A3C0